MKPFTKESRALMLKEIKQLTRKIQSKKKQLSEERRKFLRPQRDRKHRQEIHEYEMSDLIGDQLTLLEQASSAAAKCHSLLNGIVYDLKLSTQMISEGMQDQNSRAQIRKRKRSVQSDQNEENKQRPKNLNKKIKTDQNAEEYKIPEHMLNQQVQVQKPENKQPMMECQEQPMEKECQLIAQKNNQQENKRTVQQFNEVEVNDKNVPIIEQDVSLKSNQQQIAQIINIPSEAPVQNYDPIINWYSRVLNINLNHQVQPQDRIVQNQNISQPSNILVNANQNIQEAKIQSQSQPQNKDNNLKEEQEDLFQQYPKDHPNHPKGYLNSFPNHNLEYGIIQPNDIYSVFQTIKLTVPSKAHFLSHHRVPFDREEFFKYDWKNVIGFGLVKSNLSNQDFEKLSENVHIYPNLKIIRLSYNPQLTTVTADMLSKFEKLQYIHFGVFSYNCKLSDQSIQELKKYKLSHPHVLIKCLNGTDQEIY